MNGVYLIYEIQKPIYTHNYTRQRLKNGLARFTLHMYCAIQNRKILIYVPFHAWCAQGENLLIVHWQIIRSKEWYDDNGTNNLSDRQKKSLLQRWTNG